MTAPTDALRGLLNVLRDSQCLPDGDGVEATRIEVSFYALSDVLIAGHDAADRIESLLARIEAAEKVIEPFRVAIIKAPADATDNDFAAVRFRDLRAAAQWQAGQEGEG